MDNTLKNFFTVLDPTNKGCSQMGMDLHSTPDHNIMDNDDYPIDI
jgi:hypothetical protein